MKKLFSTLVVVTTIFVFTAFAGDPPPSTCVDGHVNSTGIACSQQRDGEVGHGTRSATEDSTLTYIKTLIAEYNPFIFFMN